MTWKIHGLPNKWVYYYDNCREKFGKENPLYCILSEEDQKNGYLYCCSYDLISNECFSYNQEDYEYEYEFKKFSGNAFI